MNGILRPLHEVPDLGRLIVVTWLAVIFVGAAIAALFVLRRERRHNAAVRARRAARRNAKTQPLPQVTDTTWAQTADLGGAR